MGLPNRLMILILNNLMITISIIEVIASSSTHLEKYSISTIMNFLAPEIGGKGAEDVYPPRREGPCQSNGGELRWRSPSRFRELLVALTLLD